VPPITSPAPACTNAWTARTPSASIWNTLLLSEDPIQRLRLTERLGHLPPNSVVH
jgi:hypothetical protein